MLMMLAMLTRCSRECSGSAQGVLTECSGSAQEVLTLALTAYRFAENDGDITSSSLVSQAGFSSGLAGHFAFHSAGR